MACMAEATSCFESVPVPSMGESITEGTVIEWSKAVAVLAGSNKEEGEISKDAEAARTALLDRARKCTNYGNVVGRIARTHKVQPGFGSRFRLNATSDPDDRNSAGALQLARRRVVFDHTSPYFCALGNPPPPELQCSLFDEGSGNGR